MTPFDPIALLAMLLTFYPTVGPAALVRARTERPEYFAGGTIIGRDGDALRLPDGRTFDLIFEVLTPGQRWQVIETTPGGAPAPEDPFRLEDGPIVGIDVSAYEHVPRPPIFEPLVAGELAAMGSPERALDGAETRISEAAATGAVHAVATGEIDAGETAHAEERVLVLHAVPDGVLADTIGRGGVIDAGEAQTDFTPPPYQAPQPPGSAPSGPGPGDGTTDPETGEDFPGLPA